MVLGEKHGTNYLPYTTLPRTNLYKKCLLASRCIFSLKGTSPLCIYSIYFFMHIFNSIFLTISKSSSKNSISYIYCFQFSYNKYVGKSSNA